MSLERAELHKMQEVRKTKNIPSIYLIELGAEAGWYGNCPPAIVTPYHGSQMTGELFEIQKCLDHSQGAWSSLQYL